MHIETAILKTIEMNRISVMEAYYNFFQNNLKMDHKTIDFRMLLCTPKELRVLPKRKSLIYSEKYYLAYFENLLTQTIHKIKTAP